MASLGQQTEVAEKMRSGSNAGGLRPTKVMPAQDELSPGGGNAEAGASTPRSGESKSEVEEHSVELQFESENIIPSAHYGYVVRFLSPSSISLLGPMFFSDEAFFAQYCLFAAKKDERTVLISGCPCPFSFSPFNPSSSNYLSSLL